MEHAELLVAAQELVAREFSPIPVPLGTKAPVLKGWPELRLTSESLPQYFNGKPGNIGVLTGVGGLVDIDLDFAEARGLASLILPATSCRHGRPSAPDAHWWYRCEPFPANQAFDDPEVGRTGARIAELRTTGHQTIVPPSIHPSGELLFWHESGDPLLIDSQQLVRRVRFLSALVLVCRSWPAKGARHDAAMALAGVLVRRGFPEIETAALVSTTARLAGDEEWQRRGNDAQDTCRRFHRGETTTGLPVLLDCLHISEERKHRCTEWFGSSSDTEAPAVSVRSGRERAREFTHIGALLAEPEEEHSWLVDGLLLAGGTSLVCAKPKTGKSVLAQNIAVSVARGKPILGRDLVRDPVLYCALEEKRAELRHHFRALGARADDPLYIFVGSAPGDAMDWLQEHAERHKPVLIIVDTLQRFTRLPDANDYAKVMNVLEPLLDLARRSGAHVLPVHHGNKRGGGNGDGVLGSTAFFASVDTLVGMRRSEQYRTIASTQRYGSDMEEQVLHMDPETYRVSLAGSKRDADTEGVALEILAYLEAAGEPTEEREIEHHVEGRTGLKRAALRQLLARGQIQREGGGKRGDPYRYSCSLVPHKVWEQENEKPQTDPFPHDSDTYSRSKFSTQELYEPDVREHEAKEPEFRSPCAYPTHNEVWRNDAGQTVCAGCHPPAPGMRVLTV